MAPQTGWLCQYDAGGRLGPTGGLQPIRGGSAHGAEGRPSAAGLCHQHRGQLLPQCASASRPVAHPAHYGPSCPTCALKGLTALLSSLVSHERTRAKGMHAERMVLINTKCGNTQSFCARRNRRAVKPGRRGVFDLLCRHVQRQVAAGALVHRARCEKNTSWHSVNAPPHAIFAARDPLHVPLCLVASSDGTHCSAARTEECTMLPVQATTTTATSVTTRRPSARLMASSSTAPCTRCLRGSSKRCRAAAPCKRLPA